MSKIDELQMTANVEGEELVIRLPLDLLIFAQQKREDSLFVVDKKAMSDYLEKRILDFGGDAEIGSTAFEDLIDSCFMEALENAETWLMGWWEVDDNDDEA